MEFRVQGVLLRVHPRVSGSVISTVTALLDACSHAYFRDVVCRLGLREEGPPSLDPLILRNRP